MTAEHSTAAARAPIALSLSIASSPAIGLPPYREYCLNYRKSGGAWQYHYSGKKAGVHSAASGAAKKFLPPIGGSRSYNGNVASSHSITSSALESMSGETSRPIAVAVLRLMTW
jgi:hypothetical protein